MSGHEAMGEAPPGDTEAPEGPRAAESLSLHEALAQAARQLHSPKGSWKGASAMLLKAYALLEEPAREEATLMELSPHEKARVEANLARWEAFHAQVAAAVDGEGGGEAAEAKLRAADWIERLRRAWWTRHEWRECERTQLSLRYVSRRRREVPRGSLWSAALSFFLLGGLGVALAMPWVASESTWGWVVRVHDNQDLEGEPTQTFISDIRPFHFSNLTHHPQLRGKVRNNFSLSLDGCIAVPSDQELSIDAAADDGIRVFIDGELILDDWRVGDHHGGIVTVAVDKGVHHMRVDYFQEALRAQLSVGVFSEHDEPLFPFSATLNAEGEYGCHE